MQWEKLAVEELAAYSSATGTKVKKIRESWWAEVRPFFYRPLFPLAEIDSRSAHYPLRSFAGGVFHPVPPGAPVNSQMNMFIYNDLQKYSLEVLTHKRRKLVEQGLRNFNSKPLTDIQEFEEEAYRVYVSFHDRIDYPYMKERTRRKKFAEWGEILFSFPKIQVMGSYHHGKLMAVDISFRVGGVIIGDTLFSTREALDLQVTDFIYHRVRSTAVNSGADFILTGFPTGKRSLDDSKILRGCKLLHVPSYHRFNPFALLAARTMMKEGYGKLMAVLSFPPSGQDGQVPELSVG